jgi:hypothetical protein
MSLLWQCKHCGYRQVAQSIGKPYSTQKADQQGELLLIGDTGFSFMTGKLSSKFSF